MSTPLRVRLGVLVPSSNTALEPLTNAIVSTLPNVTVHFSRFPVTEIALSPKALAQFDDSKIIAAAQLLADAKVDIIGWSGTSAGWLGLDADRVLCRRITEATGIEATTSVLGLCNIMDIVMREGRPDGPPARLGLVTPYLDDVQGKILETFGSAGYHVVSESHLRRTVNVEFADVDEQTLDRQMSEVVGKMEGVPKLVSTFCTNLRAAQRAEYWEEKYPGLVVLDTVSTVIWDMLRIVSAEEVSVDGWGKLFSISNKTEAAT